VREVVLAVLAAALGAFAPPPAGAGEKGIRIRWKFPPGKRYIYEYSDTQGFSVSSGEEASDPTISPVGKSAGRLVIACDGDGDGAALHLAKTVTSLGIVAKAEPTEEKIRYRLLSDGTCLKEGSDLEEFPCIPLFVLPRRPLPAEDPVEQKMCVHLLPEMGGAPLHGKVTFKCTGTEELSGLNCVKYRAGYELRADRGKKVEGLNAEIDAAFAPAEGCFVSVDQKLTRVHENRTENEGASPPLPPKWQFVINISLRLKSVEDIPQESDAGSD